MPLFVHRGLLLAALLLPFATAHGQTYDKSWIGFNSNWFTASNWSPSGVPTTTQSVLVNDLGPGSTRPVISSNTATVAELAVGVGAGGGELAVGANGVLQTFDVFVGRAEQAGPFTSPGNGLLQVTGTGSRLTARTGAARTLNVGGALAQGRLELLTGGLVDGNFNINVSHPAGATNDASGDVLVSGTNSRIDLGASSARVINIDANGRLVVRSGGAVNMSGTIRVENLGQLAIGAPDTQSPALAGNITAATIDLPNSGSKFTLNHTGNATVIGSVQGSGTLRARSGLSIMRGTVASSVNVVVDSGAVLQFGNNGTTGTLAGNATVNGGLTFQRSNDYNYTGVISGQGGMVHGGSGRLILTTAHTYNGGTSIFSGTLELANGGRITGAMQNNFAVLFNQSDSWTWSGNSLGSGALGKRGSGTLTLSGTHAHAGGTQVDQGTLRFAAGGLNNAGSPVFVGTNLTQLARLVGETGTVLVTGSALLGANTGTQAEVDLSNSVWTVSGDVVVGSSGRATLDVRNGTSMIAGNIGVATSSAESSTLRVQGATSSISAANVVVVGGNGPGTGLLEILQGAQFSAGELRIGTAAGRTVQDRVALSGDAHLEVVQTFSQGSASMLQVTLSAAGGGQVQVAETATISPGATLRVLTSGFMPPTGSQYTLLSAAGGLTGSYTLDTSIPDATLVHTANSVILQVGEITDEIFRDRFQ